MSVKVGAIRNRYSSSESKSLSCHRRSSSQLRAVSRGMTVSFFCTDEQNPIYTVDLTAWFKSALERLAPDFDDLIIADEVGSVLLQKSSVSGAEASVLPSVTNLRPLWVGKSNRDGSGVAPSVTKYETSTQTSSVIDADFGGLEYKVFSVPLRIPLLVGPDHPFKASANAGSAIADPAWNLAVVGFRSSDRFEADAHAIPYSTLIWAGLIGAAVFSLTWPLAKLRYMSGTGSCSRQRKVGYFAKACLSLQARRLSCS